MPRSITFDTVNDRWGWHIHVGMNKKMNCESFYLHMENENGRIVLDSARRYTLVIDLV
jgi:hypothetical protein